MSPVHTLTRTNARRAARFPGEERNRAMGVSYVLIYNMLT